MDYQLFGIWLVFVITTLFNVVSITYIATHVKQDKDALLLAVLWCILTYVLYGLVLYYAVVV